jgi:MFS family permease
MEQNKITNRPKLKLNYKRTFIIGFTFFGILMLWQVYNTYCPTILSELLKQQMGISDETQVQWIVGIIMAMDNVLALFMLPLFGMLSDKTHTKIGKRMPYIVIGTILSAIVLIFIPFAFAKNSLVGVIIVMALVLVFMNAYRNPAVSLMPDITPKPLRAKANGIINLVGYLGAIIAGALALWITPKNYFIQTGDHYQSPLIYVPFVIASVLMVVTLAVLFFTINENKILKQMEGDLTRGEEYADIEEPLQSDNKLSKKNKKNLLLMIAAIFLWFAAFNAVETFWSNYSSYYLQFDKASLAIIVLTIFSLLSFIPAGLLADKIGRKYVVLIGIGILIIGLSVCFFISPIFIGEAGYVGDKINGMAILYYALFGLCGIGWAFINCCSYPMVVELANRNNIGKFTGYYYTSSMLAQSITPIALGSLFLIPSFHWQIMFPYSATLFLAAGIIFFFVSNNKNTKVKTKKGLEAFNQD